VLFDRQRLLLSLLDALGEPVGSTDFQKLLFLFTREGEVTPSYDFVPYRFGCFSFTSYADKRRLIERGLLENDELSWRLTPSGRTEARKSKGSPLPIALFCKRTAGLRGNALIADIYRRFPYYATRSEIVEKVLPDPAAQAAIKAALPAKKAPGLVTIGYEGRSLENYLNQLLQDGVTLLCDVRRNPLSRKYGFSKTTLNKACEGVGIRYEHLPALGIPSDQRQDLTSQSDYDELFAGYERNDLPKQTATLAKIADWIRKDGQRVALTCYERLPHQCHRHCVAEALERAFGNGLRGVHI
jgi:hypothetical protein